MTTTPLLIALDLDGTSVEYEPELAVAPVVREALADAMAAGARWCMNSDRFADTQRDLALALPPEIRPVALLSIQRHIYWLEGDHYRPDREWNRAADREHIMLWRDLMPHFQEWAEEIMARFTVLQQFVDNVSFAFRIEPAEMDDLRALMTEWLTPYPDATISGNQDWAFLVHRNFSKGWILEYTARTLDIPRERVLAIGDGLNDIGMLDGLAAAMTGCPADACDEAFAAVKAAGGVLASREGPEGAAELIRRYMGLR